MSEFASLHPSDEQLRNYGLGKLAGAEHEEVERHVAECDSCCAALREVSSDGLLNKLRDADSVLLGETIAHQGSESAARRNTDEIPPQLRDHPKFRVLQKLGGGGMGVVYKAEHRLMRRLVAIKVINPWLISHPDVIQRFHREVKAASRLKHPNIVVALDAGQAGDLHLLVMEYAEGASLDRIVASRGPMAIDEACDCIRQAAKGLQHAHQRGMVHRDIKPQNIVRSPEGRVRILDFGLARIARAAENSESSLTTEGTAMGTPDYIAPEQARDSRDVDIRADIYSLGCTLYFLLTGHPPFPNRSVAEKLAGHLEHEPPPVASLRDDVPAELCRILDRMMRKDPAERYQTPAEVAAAVASIGETSAPVPPPIPPPIRPDRETPPAVPPPSRNAALPPLQNVAEPPPIHVTPAGGLSARPTSRRHWKGALRNSLWPVVGFVVLVAIGAVAACLLPDDERDSNSLAAKDRDGVIATTAGEDGRGSADSSGGGMESDDQALAFEPHPGRLRHSELDGNAPVPSAKRVLIVLPYENFWWPDYDELIRPLNRAGFDVKVASSGLGRATPYETNLQLRNQRMVPIDLLLASADAADFDAVVFSGAAAPYSNMEFVYDSAQKQAAEKFIHDMLAAGKLVTSVCNGGAVLAEAGVLDGQPAARSPMPNVIQRHQEIQWRGENEVVPGGPQILTGGSAARPQFAAELVRLLNGP